MADRHDLDGRKLEPWEHHRLCAVDPRGGRCNCGADAVAERIRLLRAKGYNAQLHPTTGRLAIWLRERWWYVVGGDAERPSLIAATESSG